MTHPEIRREFAHRFSREPTLYAAPGRVNLIGEHTDYNGGFVMPMAIGFATVAAIAPRDDDRLRVHSLDFARSFECGLSADLPRTGDWTDYPRAVAVKFIEAGYPIGGADLLLASDVPIGAGLSSSAAIEVAVALALVGNSGIALDRRSLALLCQRAENEFVGTRCGIMDQFTSCFGVEGHALVLDCRSLEFTAAPLPPEAAVVICNSMVKRELGAGAYNQRRAECERAAAVLGKSLREATLEDLEATPALGEPVARRARHVIRENLRVIAMAAALERGDLAALDGLMWESHRSLRDDFEVSCRELDLLVDIARSSPGCLGSRMTGGGFGGCTVNLVERSRVDEFVPGLRQGYEEATGLRPDLYVTEAAAGAGRVEQP